MKKMMVLVIFLIKKNNGTGSENMVKYETECVKYGKNMGPENNMVPCLKKYGTGSDCNMIIKSHDEK
jgi:hypothetical protein